MQDGIINGNGDSRYLKSAITEATTWEQFKAMLIAGTLPIDLNGINAAGWQQLATLLCKATLLKDATAALYGKGSNAVPDDIFAIIKLLLDAKQDKIVFGTYSGNDAASQDINLGFQPKAVFVLSEGRGTEIDDRPYGGLAFTNYPAKKSGTTVLGITSTGFRVFYSYNTCHTNSTSYNPKHYIAFK